MTSVLSERPGAVAGSGAASTAARGVGQSSLLLSLSAAAVAGVSYACALVMAHALDAESFSAFAAGQTLLGIVGIVSLALIPLPLVESIRSGPRGSEQRRQGMAFAVLVSLILGTVAAGLTGATTATFASPSTAVAVACSALALALVATVWGWLQGERRFPGYARSTVVEVGARLAFSLVACLLGWGAGGVLVGFAVGAVAVLLMHVREMWPDLTWRPSVLHDRARWVETRGIAVTQLVVSALAAADVVLAARWGGGSAAGYATFATLAKGPIYVATGTVLVTFPLLRDATGPRDQILQESLSSFARLAVLATVVLATIPVALLDLVLPQRYLGSVGLLPWVAVAALGHAVIAVTAIVLLALRAHARAQLGLLFAAVLVCCGLAGGWQLRGLDGLAAGGALGATLAAVALLLLAHPLLPAGAGAIGARAVVFAVVTGAVLHVAGASPVLWVAAVAGLCGLIGRRALCGRRPAAATTPDARTERLRLLHLGFEDPAMPGAGGGARRTHEINRRIALRHSVTVLVQRYPGCADRVEDGVRYVPVGFGAGRTRLVRLVGYVLRLPVAARRFPADLVIEDFFAPFSSMSAPRWTGRPTIGVVQWLNAGEKSRQYRVPMTWIERFGVRSHHRLIAVSTGVEERLRALHPGLVVDVIGNRVERVPASADAALRSEVILFIGRLETAQKGLDLLLDAWTRLGGLRAELVVAGDGPDRERLESRARSLGVDRTVRFTGWLDGDERFAHLAAARLVVVPSRFETFGMVALEAFAVGTPVVAFDIPCLRDIVPPRCGRLVPAFDVEAFAKTVDEAYRDERWLSAAADHTRRFAQRYDWDAVAARQLAVYVEEARPISVPPFHPLTPISPSDPPPGG